MKKVILNILLVFGLPWPILAQKLPKIQEHSIKAPVNTRIDGKPTEWKDAFQAYNPKTELYYTISNDQDNLYLIVQARTIDVIQKVIYGGISFTVSTSGIKTDTSNVEITFPAYTKGYSKWMVNLEDLKEVSKSIGENKVLVDSFVNLRNSQIDSKLKLIGISGIKLTNDSLLSVFNDTGVKVKSKFSSNIVYTYELAFPLKLLDNKGINLSEISYNIRVNGASTRNVVIEVDQDRKRIFVNGKNNDNYVWPLTASYLSLAFPTEFWGQYVLFTK
ncbi:hypothetical protein [Pedobacter foliorum]|uniref:hypothetical protein n=1 Tax=Pedobacter foliorum TaxID=2739058 RepID=UPI0015644CF4|nr:hypothetical protein [Pedobacter foliorum]NRF40768.1 hypothetical protein [Pedobacter foliorum]